MSVYLIAESKIIDPKAMENYRKHSIPSALKYGGRYLVAGSLPFVMEGEAKDRGMVVIEFPSKEKVLEWHHSPEYCRGSEVQRSGHGEESVCLGRCEGS